LLIAVGLLALSALVLRCRLSERPARATGAGYLAQWLCLVLVDTDWSNPVVAPSGPEAGEVVAYHRVSRQTGFATYSLRKVTRS
jgi:hypothetical protein